MTPGTGLADAERLFPAPLLEVLAQRSEDVAFEHGARAVTCGELLAIVGRVVDGLRAAGLGPGRGVAVVTGVTPEAFAAVVAVHALGGRLVGVRPGWSVAHLAEVLGDGIDVVVADPSTRTPELLAHTGSATVVSLGAHPAHPGAADLTAVVGAGQAPVVVEARPDDIARLNFTSGSTGRPKGCARTYRTFSLDFRTDRWAPDLARLVRRMRRYLLHRPPSFPAPLTFAVRSLLVGGTVVVPDGGDRDAEGRPSLADAIARHRVTGLILTVPLLQQLLARSREGALDLGSLEAVVVTGSPAGPGLLAEAIERLGPVVWQGYGQAESGMISLLTPDDIARHGDAALASVGRPLPDVEIRVEGPGPGPGPGPEGEICVRSPRAMDRYWGDPSQTREVLTEDGWLRTRDLGRLDDRGLLHLTGRSRDVVIVNAEVCYAGAIEAVLARHPRIEQAYVVGIPDERTGEAIHAFVVPRRAAGDPDPDPEPCPDELRDLVAAELTPNHMPSMIHLLGSVPVAPSGKPDKQALTALARATAGR